MFDGKSFQYCDIIKGLQIKGSFAFGCFLLRSDESSAAVYLIVELFQSIPIGLMVDANQVFVTFPLSLSARP